MNSRLYNPNEEIGYGIGVSAFGGMDISANQIGVPVRIWSGKPNDSPHLSATFDGAFTSINGTLFVSTHLLAGASSGNNHIVNKITAQGNGILNVGNGTSESIAFLSVSGAAPNFASAAAWVFTNSTNGRSINAGGTINAGGADYAEYERNNGVRVAKGQVVGFKSDGTLTDVYADAIRFGIKSTNPSYVGGDTWGNEIAVGKRPEPPILQIPACVGTPKPEKPVAPTAPCCTVNLEPSQNDSEIAATVAALAAYEQLVSAHESALADYEIAYAKWQSEDDKYQAQVIVANALHEYAMAQYAHDIAVFEANLEAARQRVDRIAYSGKVPVNVYGATPGGYIIAVPSADGGLAGEYVADPDFSQYKIAVGRVNRILEDGRCEVAVIVH